MLGDCDEDAGRQRHVEHAVVLAVVLLELLDVFPQLHEGIILVVLARDVRAEAAELVQLLFEVLGRRLDVRPDAIDEIVLAEFTARIADNLNIVREEVVPVLRAGLGWSLGFGRADKLTRPKSAGNWTRISGLFRRSNASCLRSSSSPGRQRHRELL